MGTRFGTEIEQAFEQLASRPGYGPTKIAQALESRFGGDAPKLRTIKDWLSRYTPPALGDNWLIDQMPPEDAQVVLDVQRCIVERSAGNLAHMPSNVARWVARLNRACPTILAIPEDYSGDQNRALLLYTLADAYARRRATGVSTLDLDAYLAYRPWESEKRQKAYGNAVALGWVPEPPDKHMTIDWYWIFNFLATVAHEDHEIEHGRE